jgi:hypothetical protein
LLLLNRWSLYNYYIFFSRYDREAILKRADLAEKANIQVYTLHITHYTLHITLYTLHITHYTLLLVKFFMSWVSCLPELDRSASWVTDSRQLIRGWSLEPGGNRSRTCRTAGRLRYPLSHPNCNTVWQADSSPLLHIVYCNNHKTYILNMDRKSLRF